MSAYADVHLANSEPEDYGDKTCPVCDGLGEDLYSEDLCPNCNGSGLVPKDVDDAIDDEWDAKCED